MNPIDKMALRAIWRQEKSGNKVIDDLIGALKGMALPQLARLYVRGDRGLKRLVAAEIIRRLVPARHSGGRRGN